MEVEFFEHKSVGDREWGEEILIAHAPGRYIGKLLKVKKGKGGGLQYHRFKDESDYLLSGRLLVEYVKDGKLTYSAIEAGNTIRFPPTVIHRTVAAEDCVIIEFSTPHFNDRVRVEEQFGLSSEGGLPTTQPEDVEVR